MMINWQTPWNCQIYWSDLLGIVALVENCMTFIIYGIGGCQQCHEYQMFDGFPSSLMSYDYNHVFHNSSWQFLNLCEKIGHKKLINFNFMNHDFWFFGGKLEELYFPFFFFSFFLLGYTIAKLAIIRLLSVLLASYCISSYSVWVYFDPLLTYKLNMCTSKH